MFHLFRKFSHRHGCISEGMRSFYNGFRSRHEILTLDPNKFAEKKQPCLHIGNLKAFRPLVFLKQSSHAIPSYSNLYYDKLHAMKSKSYPPETNAFLYYFMSSEKPRIAGELRLRVTSSNDVALFESGSDLLRPDGQIWFRPLHNLSKFYPPLYEKLREDQLIPDDLDRVLATLSSRRYSYSRSHFLYTLNDTFILDFSRRQHVFSTITEQGVHRLPFNYIFFDRRDISNKRPYRGNALVRLERSSLPDHKGTRTVVLRFLKIITPVKCVIPQYDGYISCPKEGELYQRRHARSKASQIVWSVNIDESDGPTSPGPGLRLLWDA